MSSFTTEEGPSYVKAPGKVQRFSFAPKRSEIFITDRRWRGFRPQFGREVGQPRLVA